MSENDTETEYACVKDPLKMQRTGSNERTIVSEIPNIINEKNVIIVPGQGKILSDEFWEEQSFLYLLPRVNLPIMLLKIFQYVLLEL